LVRITLRQSVRPNRSTSGKSNASESEERFEMKPFTRTMVLALSVAAVLPSILNAQGPPVLQFVPPPAAPVPIPPGLIVACCYSPTGPGGEEYCRFTNRVTCRLIGGRVVEGCAECGLDWEWEED
jgi:hypothetical protein